LAIPRSVPGVPDEILLPENAWSDPQAYRRAAERLARLFQQNFRQFADVASPETKAAGPRVSQAAGV
jgi:phosphoenolpyruvate carboxykinase (ATP)